MMKTVLFTLALFIAVPTALLAQTQTSPASRLGWDQGAANLAEANTFGATLFIDAVGTLDAPGVVLTGKSCTGAASPFPCVANLPAMTPGPHVLQLAATIGTVSSARSTSFNIVMVVIATPTGLRIVDMFGTDPMVEKWHREQFESWRAQHGG